MSQITSENDNWKRNAYVIGLGSGALFGLLSAYLYTRSASEAGKQPDSVPTSTLIGLLLAALGLMRQIAEAGKPRK